MDLGPGVDTTRDETSRTQKTLPDKTKKKVTIEEAGSSFRLVEVMHTFDFFHIQKNNDLVIEGSNLPTRPTVYDLKTNFLKNELQQSDTLDFKKNYIEYKRVYGVKLAVYVA